MCVCIYINLQKSNAINFGSTRVSKKLIYAYFLLEL